MFQRRFEEEGEPIVHNGIQLWLVDRIAVAQGDVLRVTRRSTSSNWRQGVCLDVQGTLVVNNTNCGGTVVLWEDTAPYEVDVTLSDFSSQETTLYVRNVWDTGNGVMQSWHNGAAMIVDERDGVRLYRCNDGAPDDDFDDLVFTIHKISKRRRFLLW